MQSNANFLEVLWDYYAKNGRDLLWRSPEADGSFDPYKILVSEIMLQQTQVGRVTKKYAEFLEKFPSVKSLASAKLSEVLSVWSGLGYNRRAKFLHQAAQVIVDQHNGDFPQTLQGLTTLPGVGHNTAAAIMVYWQNKTEIFIETNVRSVYIHHFFQHDEVEDKQIREKLTQTIDKENPREFYWALMDYGTFLKREHGNMNRRSKHYVKQSRFKGSRRQVRGQVLRALLEDPHTITELSKKIHDERLVEVTDQLLKENLIQKHGSKYSIA